MPVNIDNATDADCLLNILAGINISVPRRIGGRITDHTETWIIARLLSTLAEGDRLTFPLSVIHQDKPDILIVQSGIEKIGVEITEAISPQFAACCALAEREFPGAILEPAHFRWDAPHLTTAQMRDLLRENILSSFGWLGDRAEHEWALFIQSVVDSKLDKLAQNDFAKYSQNWLAIYDNLPLPAIDLGKATSFLIPPLQNRWTRKPSFNVISIEHGDAIIRITSDSNECLKLNNLWD